MRVAKKPASAAKQGKQPKAARSSPSIPKGIKAMNVRLPKEMWRFLKQTSLDQEISINSIITRLVSDYRNYSEMQAPKSW